MTRSLARKLAPLFGLALTAGCTVFPNPEPPRVMDLTLTGNIPVAEKRIPASLRVDTPYASEPYNSTRIMAKPTPQEFRIYEGVRWRDTIPVVVRDTLISAIRQGDAFANVITETNPGQADLSLITELSAFHADTRTAPPEVTIELHLQIIHNRSRDRLCIRNIRITHPADGSSVDQIVAAFGSAGSNLAAGVIEWAMTCDYPSRLSPSRETDPPRQP